MPYSSPRDWDLIRPSQSLIRRMNIKLSTLCKFQTKLSSRHCRGYLIPRSIVPLFSRNQVRIDRCILPSAIKNRSGYKSLKATAPHKLNFSPLPKILGVEFCCCCCCFQIRIIDHTPLGRDFDLSNPFVLLICKKILLKDWKFCQWRWSMKRWSCKCDGKHNGFWLWLEQIYLKNIPFFNGI